MMSNSLRLSNKFMNKRLELINYSFKCKKEIMLSKRLLKKQMNLRLNYKNRMLLLRKLHKTLKRQKWRNIMIIIIKITIKITVKVKITVKILKKR